LIKVVADDYKTKDGGSDSSYRFFATKHLPLTVKEENKMLMKRMEVY
jgi:hypothetical protein